MGFPWSTIIPAIDNESFDYRTGEKAKQVFKDKTQMHWDNLDDSLSVSLQCSLCKRHCKAPWTEWDKPDMWKSQGKAGFVGEWSAHGFADRQYLHVCECKAQYTHDVLRLQKFQRDLKHLRTSSISMQGTILNSTGKETAG